MSGDEVSGVAPSGEARKADGGEASSSSAALVPAQSPVSGAPTDPAWSTRGTAPGPHGCWALNKRGEPCKAAKRADGDYCNAHSGVGVSANPRHHSIEGIRRSAESRTRRAELRLLLGTTRPDSPRVALRAAAILNAERLASSAIDAATNPTIEPSKRGQMALQVIEAADPRNHAVVSVTSDPSELGISELLALAQEHGIQPVEQSVKPVDNPIEGYPQPASE